jgi:ankyrin repeat protein
MKTVLAVIAACFIVFGLFTASGFAQSDDQRAITRVPPTGKRVALVIGNKNYEVKPLTNTLNDAEDMGNALKRLGFAVTTGTNLNRKAFVAAVEKFVEQSQGADAALFYFSGHGCQLKGENYLIPLGCRFHSEAEIEFETVNAGFVLASMGKAKARVNIVILDACRDNPLSISRSLNRGLTQMNHPKGTLLAFATAPGETASDGTGRNGVYTKHLLASLNIKNLTIENVFKFTARGVTQETNDKQVPWTSSSLIGDLIINPKDITPEPVPRPIQPPKPPEKPKVRDPEKDKALITASYGRNNSDVLRFLDEGADVNTRNEDGATPLMIAVRTNNPGLMLFLLRHKPNIDARDKDDFTPLMWASAVGHVLCAAQLLDEGANINEQGGLLEQTPLMLAVCGGHLEMVQLLLEKGANVYVKHPQLGNALLMSNNRRGNQHQIINLLKRYGGKEDYSDDKGIALTQAASIGDIATVQKLLGEGADVDQASDKGGYTALINSSSNGHIEVARLLLARGANVNAATCLGDTSLILAASIGHVEIVRLLLENGADAKVVNKEGASALKKAEESGRGATAILLRKYGAK